MTAADRSGGLTPRGRLLAVVAVATGAVLGVIALTGGGDASDPPVVADASPTPGPSPTTTSTPTTTPEPAPTTDPPTSTATPEPSPTATAAPTEDDGAPAWVDQVRDPWAPGEGEVLAGGKLVAAEVVTALATYDPGGADDQRAVVAATATGATTLDGAEGLAHDGAWSRARVVYPQLGGFAIGADPDTGRVPPTGPVDDRQTMSVMVLVEQWWGDGDEPTVELRTMDVRLEREDQDAEWRLVDVPDVGGSPLPPPDDPHPLLTDDRVSLPDSARWDVAGGIVDRQLLDVLVDAAAVAPLEVLVFASGHPVEVFATDRISAHTRGLAVDIIGVGGRRVAASHDRGSPARELVETLYQDPRVRNIGSPWAMDGFGGRSFTDVVHTDHIHVAVFPLGSEPSAIPDPVPPTDF